MHYHLPNVELLLARNIDAKRLCFAEMHSAAVAKKSTFLCSLLILDTEERTHKKVNLKSGDLFGYSNTDYSDVLAEILSECTYLLLPRVCQNKGERERKSKKVLAYPNSPKSI